MDGRSAIQILFHIKANLTSLFMYPAYKVSSGLKLVLLEVSFIDKELMKDVK